MRLILEQMLGESDEMSAKMVLDKSQFVYHKSHVQTKLE